MLTLQNFSVFRPLKAFDAVFVMQPACQGSGCRPVFLNNEQSCGTGLPSPGASLYIHWPNSFVFELSVSVLKRVGIKSGRVMKTPPLETFFPFLRWFPMTKETLRADIIAGLTVALVLIPQSMAYASLAGLPVVYGLYASFVPVIVASLWGSSSQLHTGPVAMLSLMSAAALIPFATPGSETFIALSVMLALMVGILRLLLGLFSLGALVNLLSSPVIVGFTNAAALIIGLSQLNKVLGVPFPRTENYLADLWRVLTQIPDLHWPTLGFALGAVALILGLRKWKPNLPGVLIAVLLGTVISAAVGLEQKVKVSIDQIADPTVREMLEKYDDGQRKIAILTTKMTELEKRASAEEREGGAKGAGKATKTRALLPVLEYQRGMEKKKLIGLNVDLHHATLYAHKQADGTLRFFSQPAKDAEDQRRWRFAGVKNGVVTLSAGGDVVGVIPKGLPSFQVPEIHWSLLLSLLPAALVMALIGFMEATSISKAIATSTGERVDTSKELIGQGLANIAGSFFGSYTVSGSFSRSAVAARAGAKTGLFAIVSALAVVLVLLFFTDYLYHLPQAVLAVIVMIAVFGLIRIEPLIRAWKVDRAGALIGITTFFATLIVAPAIANGILIGIALTVANCLVRSMKPRAEIVARKPDGTLGGIRVHHLKPLSRKFVPVRFDGPLTFSTVAYFEDIILEACADFPDAKVILIIGSGINELDASGEEKIRELHQRLKKLGIKLMFSGLKYQVRRLLEKGGLIDEMGRDAFVSDKETAFRRLMQEYPNEEPDEASEDKTTDAKVKASESV